MTRVRCANCATVFARSEGVCPGCGMGVEAIGMDEPGLDPVERATCPRCEEPVGMFDTICVHCGAELDDDG